VPCLPVAVLGHPQRRPLLLAALSAASGAGEPVMGRPPIWGRAMSAAERKRRQRERKRAQAMLPFDRPQEEAPHNVTSDVTISPQGTPTADANLWDCRARTPEHQAEYERLCPETIKRAAEISEHNAQVLLNILHEHFIEVLLE
jgi:hypothetical protein